MRILIVLPFCLLVIGCGISKKQTISDLQTMRDLIKRSDSASCEDIRVYLHKMDEALALTQKELQ